LEDRLNRKDVKRRKVSLKWIDIITVRVCHLVPKRNSKIKLKQLLVKKLKTLQKHTISVREIKSGLF